VAPREPRGSPILDAPSLRKEASARTLSASDTRVNPSVKTCAVGGIQRLEASGSCRCSKAGGTSERNSINSKGDALGRAPTSPRSLGSETVSRLIQIYSTASLSVNYVIVASESGPRR
jgi:hypothetical protein